MSGHHGRFTWCELATTDLDAAATFYGSVLGWAATDAGMADRRYTVVNAGSDPVGGIMALPPALRDAGGRPHWVPYIGVDDVDAMAARIRAANGAVHRLPEDIPGVGRFAVVADPQGAVFTIFAPQGMPPLPAAGPMTAGHVGWHELQAAHWESAFAFYADLFGWTKGAAHDMGPIGAYQLFATGGATMVGGMMTKTDATPMPVWVTYFAVDGIEAALARLGDAGGRVLNGPMEVPGGSWVAQALDPQGALFAMVGAQR